MLFLALLGCTRHPPLERGGGDSVGLGETGGEETDGRPETGADSGGTDTDDTGLADTGGDDSGPADTGGEDTGGPEAFDPVAVFVLGQFAWFADGTVGTAWNHASALPPTVTLRVVGEAWFGGDTAASCRVGLTALSGTTLPGESWAFTDTWEADTDGDGIVEVGTATFAHHGFKMPGDAVVTSDCPFAIEALLAAGWGAGVGTPRPDVVAALEAAGIDPAGFFGGGAWAPGLLEGGAEYTALDYGFAFAMDPDGQLTREDGGVVRLDSALVGDDAPPEGFYQTIQAYSLGFPAE